MSFLQFTAIGNVGHSPKSRDVQDKTVVNFSVATSRKVKGEKVTTWVAVQSWSEHKNKVITDYVGKGQRIFVQGPGRIREYEDRDGAKRFELEIDITYGELVLLGDKEDGGREAPPKREAARPRGGTATQPSYDDLDDEIPF